MKLLILDDGYPSNELIYGDVFVHVRVKEYIKIHECLVASFLHKADYVYEGVCVKALKNIEQFKELIESYNPDLILMHFAMRDVIQEVVLKSTRRFIIWVHGYEVIGWYRRLFNLEIRDLHPKKFIYLIYFNILQRREFRKVIKESNRSGRIHFVFVSKWMSTIASRDTLFSKIDNFSVIPNPIDDKLFKYSDKAPELRKRILLIRTFETKKYANDIAFKAIRLLSRYPLFNDLKFTIYGKGKYFIPLTNKIKMYPNIELYNHFIPQKEIPASHATAGIFLCPTRQDSHGVSMCEAMCSGLVPVTSNNSAIPEYVENGVDGFTTMNAREIADRIKYLYENPSAFLEMSKKAASDIREKASIKKVVEAELELIKNMNIPSPAL